MSSTVATLAGSPPRRSDGVAGGPRGAGNSAGDASAGSIGRSAVFGAGASTGAGSAGLPTGTSARLVDGTVLVSTTRASTTMGCHDDFIHAGSPKNSCMRESISNAASTSRPPGLPDSRCALIAASTSGSFAPGLSDGSIAFRRSGSNRLRIWIICWRYASVLRPPSSDALAPNRPQPSALVESVTVDHACARSCRAIQRSPSVVAFFSSASACSSVVYACA